MGDILEQINILIDVQGIEMEIMRADRRINALNGEKDSLNKELAEREARVASDRQVLDDLKKAYRELDLESKEYGESITKSNEKLRVVKTNKEYQSILKEIEDIIKKKSDMEDRMLEQLEEIDSKESSVKENETELDAFIESCREKKETFVAKGESQKKAVASLIEKKNQIESKADAKVIAILEDVKKKVRGTAVVPVQGAICTGCHMNIPAQLHNELQRLDELRFCPHCHRIIYWKGTK